MTLVCWATSNVETSNVMPKAQIRFDSLVKQTNSVCADIRHPPYLIKIANGTLLWQTHRTMIEILIGIAIGRASKHLEFF